LTEKSVGGKI